MSGSHQNLLKIRRILTFFLLLIAIILKIICNCLIYTLLKTKIN